MYSMHDGMQTSIHLEVAQRLQPKTCVEIGTYYGGCLLYTSPSPRDVEESRMPSSA